MDGWMDGWMDACYTYSNRYVHSLSPRHVERNYVSRRSIVSRRTRVRNYVRCDVDILRHPDSLINKLPELVYKLVLSIPVIYYMCCQNKCACFVRPSNSY